jgi:DNA-binding NtrC family response regulator
MKPSKQSRILIIDDQETIRKSLKLALEREGYLVDTAENGRQAIRKSKRRLYNLALVDLRLPDMDGIELLTNMRETVPKMVKIIITGYPSLENAIEAVNRGADGYIVKPYAMENLLRKIKERLQKQQEAKRYSEERLRSSKRHAPKNPSQEHQRNAQRSSWASLPRRRCSLDASVEIWTVREPLTIDGRAQAPDFSRGESQCAVPPVPLIWRNLAVFKHWVEDLGHGAS